MEGSSCVFDGAICGRAMKKEARRSALHFKCPKCGARRYENCNGSLYYNYSHKARRELAREYNEGIGAS